MAEAPPDHADPVRAALTEIVSSHGPQALSDPDSMSRLLQELLPQAPREVGILVAAAQDNLAESLRAHLSQGTDAETAAGLAASSFAASSSLPAEDCAWATSEIAAALGIDVSPPDGHHGPGGSGIGDPAGANGGPGTAGNGAGMTSSESGTDASGAADRARRSRAGSTVAIGEAGLEVRHRPLALTTLCLVLFLTFLDITIVSVALSGIQTELHAGVSSLQWVVGAYALTFASTMLLFGTIGDQFGRKKVMVAGVAVYCVGALLCGLSVTIAGASALPLLLACRAVMGLGAAASEPGTLSMLRHLYPEYASRNRALGVWAAVSGFSLALGPVIGGGLVYLVSRVHGWNAQGWRAIFFFDVAFGLVALIAAVVYLPENSDPDTSHKRIDISGALFGAVALASLIFAVINAESMGFESGEVIGLLAVSLVATVAFVIRENRAAHPLLDLRFLHIPRFATPNIVAFCAYFATFAIFFFTALFLEEVTGYNGGQIAEVFLPMTALMILASLLAGRWTGSVGVRWSIVGGCTAFALGLILTNAVISPNPPYLPLAAALALTGIGIGTCVVPITSSVLAAVPPERSGMAASSTNTSREVGAVMGVAILGAIVIGKLQTALVASLTRLGLPKAIQPIVINGVLTGQEPSAGKGSSLAPAGQGKLVTEVIHATYSAFESGLHDALYVSAGLVALAGIITAITLRVGSDQAGLPVSEEKLESLS
jgi:EmrB/QacA subfamily drug resistance transporter